MITTEPEGSERTPSLDILLGLRGGWGWWGGDGGKGGGGVKAGDALAGGGEVEGDKLGGFEFFGNGHGGLWRWMGCGGGSCVWGGIRS